MSKINKNCSRREFLKAATLTAAVTQSGMPWFFNLSLASSAAAQTATDYKAIVCLFLLGGNDSCNTILATDQPSWTQYEKWRSLNSIGLPRVGATGGVLPISPKTPQSGRSFALHPNLSGLVDIFNQKRLAIVPNIGPISGPMDVRDYKKGVEPFFPPALFSHSDQQFLWQAQSTGGGAGWGGRMGDLLSSVNGSNTIFTSISANGSSYYLSGLNTISYVAGRDGGVQMSWLKSDAASRQKATANILRRIVSRDSQNLFEKEASTVTRRSINANAILSSSILPRGAGGVPDPSQIINPDGVTEDNPLAVQLQTVARIIGAQSTLGMKRQIFYVTLDGFDTHEDQKKYHNFGMLRLNHGLTYFDNVLGTLNGQNKRNQVTLFTASDFGRRFTLNSSNGTDHGFGGHHFVMGGSVAGGDIYGTFPQSGLNHDRDFGLGDIGGNLLPQFSVEQYGATLARWFGLSDSQLNDIFPNLIRFSPRDLGFFG
jgi:uncharacterized protein (DUF1501 family)